MSLVDQNLIIGIHAIQAAIANHKRHDFELLMTEEGHKELADALSGRNDIKQIILEKHELQEKSKKIYRKHGLEYHKVAGGAMLLCSALEVQSSEYLYQVCESQEKLKIVILDGVTDIHNAGAIVRTASFYGADILLIGGKFSFAMTPSFFKVASGGIEDLTVVQATGLPRVIKKIQQRGVAAFALSEHAQEELAERAVFPQVAIVLGAEGRGISHALLRQCERKLALKALGGTSSLNVSVAAAIAMERLFSFT